jgi:hypothetical protein
MTLANLALLLCFLASAPHTVSHGSQAAGAEASQATQGTTSQQPAAEGQSPSEPSQAESKGTRSPARKANAAKKRGRSKKAAAITPCVPPPTKPNPTNSAPQDAPGDAAKSGSTSAGASVAGSKDCPPPKIVVRQGGSKEPSIQLAGGNADHAAQQRDGINQLLGQTDENLKKAEETQLNQSQQEIVTQTRQYVVQSKAAMANGDFERARTLAWKAQLLSQDLAKVEK